MMQLPLPSLAATAACRSRHGPPASCSAPMGSRLRCLLTVRPGMPPWPPPPPRTPRQSRLRCRTSAVSPRAPRTFQKSREAAACRVWMSVPPVKTAAGTSGRFAPVAPRWSGMAHPCPRGCISRCNSAILAYRATAIRHLGVAIHEQWLPRPHRISTGLLVSQSVGMAPDNAATGRLQHGRYNSAGTKAAPEKSSYHPCRCCAQGRFSAPSLPDSPHRATGRGRRLRPLPAAGR